MNHRLPTILLLLLVLALPAARAIPFNMAASATVWHTDNLSNATESADRRGDTALSLAVGGDQPHTLARDWLFSWGGGLTSDLWNDYDQLDQAGLGGRMSLRRRFGLGSLAPSLTASVAGGPVWVRESDLGGWQGTAALTFSHRPIEELRYTLSVAEDRFDARNSFFSRTGHTFAGTVQAYLGESWSLTVGARQREGNVLSFANLAEETVAPYDVLPWITTNTFGGPLDAYNLRARTRAVSLTLALALGPRTTFTLGAECADTRWHGLGYRNHLLSAGLTQQF